MQIEYGQLHTNAAGEAREVLAVTGDIVDYLEQSGEDPQQRQCTVSEFERWVSVA